MTSLLWLMRDFRFHDNEALRAAAAEGPVLPVFLLDASVAQMGAAPRWRLQQALQAFDAAWKQRTGQHLTVMRGEAAAVLPGLAARIGATGIFQNDWPWQPVHQAQDQLEAALRGSGIRFHRSSGHLLIAPARLLSGRAGPYRVYTPFARRLREAGADLPVPEAGRVTALPSEGLLSALEPLAPEMRGGAAVLAEHALPAGEAAALARLEEFLEDPGGYSRRRDFPAEAAGSGLSAALALGEISPRRIWARCGEAMRQSPERAEDLKTFLSEVLWREFAWHLLIGFPAMPQRAWRPEWEHFPWRGPSPEAEAWRRAATGVPLVDAGLRELQITGRMENRVRMVVASWLTKHLLTDWRIGLSHFGESLVDWDPASNAMNWQWVAGCGPDAAPFFRIFSPVRQEERFDPQGRYIRHWLTDPAMVRAWEAAIPSAWRDAARPPPPSPADYSQMRERALQALQRHKQASG